MNLDKQIFVVCCDNEYMLDATAAASEQGFLHCVKGIIVSVIVVQMNFYVYYSYEPWGRGYIGSRGCDTLPECDTKYFGSYYDPLFSPTEKIILAVFATRKEAVECEIVLHDFFEVDVNPHFANQCRQTSTGFVSNGVGMTGKKHSE
jgi:hypothetical protein